MSKTGKDIPHELRGKLAAFDKALTDVENKFQPLLDVSQVDLKLQLDSLDKAKIDLVAVYSINSLFWMYLNVCGVNPKDHGIKQELERVRSYMNRVKEIEDKLKAPKLDVPASKRFVRNALWEAAQKSITPTCQEESATASEEHISATASEEPASTSKSKGEKRSKKGKKRKSKDKDSSQRKVPKIHQPKRYMDGGIK